MHTVKDTAPYDKERAEDLRQYSRLKYGMDAERDRAKKTAD